MPPNKKNSPHATRNQSHTRSSSPEKTDRTQSTKTSTRPRSQSKTRRSAPSASATDSLHQHQVDSETLLKPSIRLTTLSRSLSGKITLLNEAARNENLEVKKYYNDDGESEGENVKSDTPKSHDIDSDHHRENCDRLVKVSERLSKRVRALTNDVKMKRGEGKTS